MYGDLNILPSKVFFSQESISNVFESNYAHVNVKIGETLDQLCNGEISVYEIPTIEVVEKDGKFYAADNRRLWVFRELEKLGKCKEIPVRVVENFKYGHKFTTRNGGTSVKVRGDPGGRSYQQGGFGLGRTLLVGAVALVGLMLARR